MFGKIAFGLAAVSGIVIGREIVGSRGALEWAVVVLFGGQLLAALAGFIAARPLESARKDSSFPNLFALIPVAGFSEGLEDGVRRFLSQSYPGKSRVVYVVPSENDPSVPVLRSMGAEVWAADRPRSQAPGKLTDMAYAVERIPPEFELVLLTEADLLVKSGFFAALAEPFLDERTSMTVGWAVPTSRRISFWSSLSLAWVAGGFPGTVFLPVPWGGAVAVRRKELVEERISEQWKTAFSDDGVLAANRRLTRRVRFAADAVASHQLDFTASGFFRHLHRCFVCARIYAPRLWTMGGLAIMGKWALLLSFVYPRFNAEWVLSIIAAEAAYFGIVGIFMSRKAGLPAIRGVLAGAVSPVLWIVLCVQFARSIFDDVVYWGARRFRLRSPFGCEEIR